MIVGFSSSHNANRKLIYESNVPKQVENINPYLVAGEVVFIEARRTPICGVPVFVRGSQPTDDGNFILTADEKEAFIAKEPQAEKFIRPFMMGKDFIDRKPRYCLWLVDALPQDIRQCPEVMKRVAAVREFRLNSKKPATRKKADTPMLFDEVKNSKTDYIAVPVVSSENRRYIPVDFLPSEIIAGNKLFTLSEVSLYHFGVLTSNVHMAWMRVVAGRLKSDYSYSNTVVYNNFPWCNPTDKQRAKIEKTAQGILDARAKYPDSSLADLYDEVTMPPELRKAHQANDRAVMEAYGFWGRLNTESECVAELMKMYQHLTTK